MIIYVIICVLLLGVIIAVCIYSHQLYRNNINLESLLSTYFDISKYLYKVNQQTKLDNKEYTSTITVTITPEGDINTKYGEYM